jgi:hypothetical protein
MYFLVTSKDKKQHRILFFENNNSYVTKIWIKDENDKSYILYCDQIADERRYSINTDLFTIDYIRGLTSWNMKEISEEKAFSLLL